MMATGNQAEQFDPNRFSGSNWLTFTPPWSEAEVGWWRDHMFKPHGLYPDDLGELLSASIVGNKLVTLSDLDVRDDSFVIRVTGRANETGEAWWHQRRLDLRGQIFEAQRMIIPLEDQQKGRGRLLMADLVDTAARLGIRQITVEAQDVGRYAWARLGFVPDRGSWNFQIRIEARRRLLRSRGEIEPSLFSAYLDTLDGEDPLLIRQVAEWNVPVDSLRDFDENGNPAKIAIGKALLLETGAQWYGVFDLDDEETMNIFKRYVARP
jgi:hypothetical protein